MAKKMIMRAATLDQAWHVLVPAYESRQYVPFVLTIEKWNPKHAEAIRQISPKRAKNRFQNYVDGGEVARVFEKLEAKRKASIRFGVQKPGHGYHGERGDFCLVGGAIEGKNLTLFYRSLELIGGLAYDVCLIDELGSFLEIKWKQVQIMSVRANVFAVKRNSNEKLYPKLQEIFSE